MPARRAGGRVLGGALLGVGVAVLHAGVAWACVRPAQPEFSLDPTDTGDRQPPTRPVALQASVSRHNGSFCGSDDVCVVSSCGSVGALQLDITPATDDRAAASELGYRLRWAEGSVPPALEEPLRGIVLGTQQLRFELPFDAIPELDASFELIAIDRAGNESEASEPFHAIFDGCTRSIGFAGCAEDTGGRVSCSEGTCFEVTEGTRIEGGCTLGLLRRPPSAARGLLPLLAACALPAACALRRRGRARR